MHWGSKPISIIWLCRQGKVIKWMYCHAHGSWELNLLFTFSSIFFPPSVVVVVSFSLPLSSLPWLYIVCFHPLYIQLLAFSPFYYLPLLSPFLSLLPPPRSFSSSRRLSPYHLFYLPRLFSSFSLFQSLIRYLSLLLSLSLPVSHSSFIQLSLSSAYIDGKKSHKNPPQKAKNNHSLFPKWFPRDINSRS